MKWGVRVLLANPTQLSTTSETLSYVVSLASVILLFAPDQLIWFRSQQTKRLRQCGWDDKQGAAHECHGDNSGQILWLVASSTTVVLPQATTCFAVLTAIPLERNTWGNERPRWWTSNLIQWNFFFVSPFKVRIPRYKISFMCTGYVLEHWTRIIIPLQRSCPV